MIFNKQCSERGFYRCGSTRTIRRSERRGPQIPFDRRAGTAKSPAVGLTYREPLPGLLALQAIRSTVVSSEAADWSRPASEPLRTRYANSLRRPSKHTRQTADAARRVTQENAYRRAQRTRLTSRPSPVSTRDGVATYFMSTIRAVTTQFGGIQPAIVNEPLPSDDQIYVPSAYWHADLLLRFLANPGTPVRLQDVIDRLRALSPTSPSRGRLRTGKRSVPT